MRVNRRRARCVVLALFLLALIGPWDIYGSRLTYFPDAAENLLQSSDRADLLILAVIVAVPVACAAAILAPVSRLRAIVYRVLAAGTAALFGVTALGVLSYPSRRHELIEVSGFSLYLVALLLALASEVIPAPPARKPSCADVFR